MLLSFSKKKSCEDNDVEVLTARLDHLQERERLLLQAVRALCVLLGDFALDAEELEAEALRKRLAQIAEKFASEPKTRKIAALFERGKLAVGAFIGRQKDYLQERESEFKEIIDLLTGSLASLDADNRLFTREVHRQGESMESLARLDDLRKIKSELRARVDHLHRTVQAKQDRDDEKLQRLSQQIRTLNYDLEMARAESETDALTGLRNRAALDRYLQDLVERSNLRHRPFALIIFDIDDFKQINDTFGHTVGDRVLATVASKCRAGFREADFVARYGGEEFVAVLPGASLRGAAKRGRQVCKNIAASRYAVDPADPTETITLTISVGISVLRKGDTVESLVQRADRALYGAKQAGKNRVLSEKEISTVLPAGGGRPAAEPGR